MCVDCEDPCDADGVNANGVENRVIDPCGDFNEQQLSNDRIRILATTFDTSAPGPTVLSMSINTDSTSMSISVNATISSSSYLFCAVYISETISYDAATFDRIAMDGKKTLTSDTISSNNSSLSTGYLIFPHLVAANDYTLYCFAQKSPNFDNYLQTARSISNATFTTTWDKKVYVELMSSNIGIDEETGYISSFMRVYFDGKLTSGDDFDVTLYVDHCELAPNTISFNDNSPQEYYIDVFACPTTGIETITDSYMIKDSKNQKMGKLY